MTFLQAARHPSSSPDYPLPHTLPPKFPKCRQNNFPFLPDLLSPAPSPSSLPDSSSLHSLRLHPHLPASATIRLLEAAPPTLRAVSFCDGGTVNDALLTSLGKFPFLLSLQVYRPSRNLCHVLCMQFPSLSALTLCGLLPAQLPDVQRLLRLRAIRARAEAASHLRALTLHVDPGAGRLHSGGVDGAAGNAANGDARADSGVVHSFCLEEDLATINSFFSFAMHNSRLMLPKLALFSIAGEPHPPPPAFLPVTASPPPASTSPEISSTERNAHKSMSEACNIEGSTNSGHGLGGVDVLDGGTSSGKGRDAEGIDIGVAREHNTEASSHTRGQNGSSCARAGFGDGHCSSFVKSHHDPTPSSLATVFSQFTLARCLITDGSARWPPHADIEVEDAPARSVVLTARASTGEYRVVRDIMVQLRDLLAQRGSGLRFSVMCSDLPVARVLSASGPRSMRAYLALPGDARSDVLRALQEGAHRLLRVSLPCGCGGVEVKGGGPWTFVLDVLTAVESVREVEVAACTLRGAGDVMEVSRGLKAVEWIDVRINEGCFRTGEVAGGVKRLLAGLCKIEGGALKMVTMGGGAHGGEVMPRRNKYGGDESGEVQNGEEGTGVAEGVSANTVAVAAALEEAQKLEDQKNVDVASVRRQLKAWVV